MQKKILVTGAAGFIGMFLVKKLLSLGESVIGIDNLNNYYNTELKFARLGELGVDEQSALSNENVISRNNKNFVFRKCALEDFKDLESIFKQNEIYKVINLAAQAGVRYSLINPHTYIQSNINGFVNLLELCREYKINHLIYASSSSVYGMSDQVPFSTEQNVDNPISVYAATKKSNELLAHVYSHLYNLPTTGLRFFTVYGPWGRPDMAYFSFTKSILEGKEIHIYNNGDMKRDFTYIDDIIEGIVRISEKPSCDSPPYQLFNIGNNTPVKLLDFIKAIEDKLQKEANKVYLPMQPGDVYTTYADVSSLKKAINYTPNTPIEEGLSNFIDWYLSFYKDEFNKN
jgi:UDP-glucuronate 4-epimerase